ncbi:hypothetical protein GCM10009676_13660 [Prauserella halophila]|uniref:Heparan-alpha-glucosaminide N-acetyltransferase catalytic domain-containing protein n=1 Tax=Prauserella halophila TaxID=185641 RepID=A0ABN1W767_9PSEU|nr:acyltransferase family protein [Prauserella halophila]MCP2236420.1 putative membrane protein YeiB [Prauserella halophila]
MSQPRTTPRWRAHIPHGRLLGIDVLRALAILGMVWTHFALSGWVSPGQGPETPEVLDWVNGLVHVRSREIFFLLAGVTVALATGGAAPHRGRTLAGSSLRMLVRAVVLLILALVLGELGSWDIQILHYYALWLVLLLPLTLLRARTLFITAGVLALVAPVGKLLQNNLNLFEPDMSVMMRLQEHQGFSLLLHPGDWLPTLQHVLVGTTPTAQDTIAVLPFLVLGLALGRLDLREHAVRTRLLRTGGATALGAVVVSLAAMYPFGTAGIVNAAGEPDAAGNAPAPWQELVTLGSPGPAHTMFSIVEYVGTMGLIAALLGGLLIAVDRQAWRRLLWPLAAFGSMALTWYFAHFLILDSSMFTTTQGMPANRTLLAFVVFAAVALAGSVLWRLWAARGPLEFLQHRAIGLVPQRQPAKQTEPEPTVR